MDAVPFKTISNIHILMSNVFKVDKLTIYLSITNLDSDEKCIHTSGKKE